MDANTLIEEDFCSLLLMTLGTSFTTFRDTIFYAHKDLTWKTIHETLLSKEMMNHMEDGPTTIH